jgi:hypothetical protein
MANAQQQKTRRQRRPQSDVPQAHAGRQREYVDEDFLQPPARLGSHPGQPTQLASSYNAGSNVNRLSGAAGVPLSEENPLLLALPGHSSGAPSSYSNGSPVRLSQLIVGSRSEDSRLGATNGYELDLPVLERPTAPPRASANLRASNMTSSFEGAAIPSFREIADPGSYASGAGIAAHRTSSASGELRQPTRHQPGNSLDLRAQASDPDPFIVEGPPSAPSRVVNPITGRKANSTCTQTEFSDVELPSQRKIYSSSNTLNDDGRGFPEEYNGTIRSMPLSGSIRTLSQRNLAINEQGMIPQALLENAEVVLPSGAEVRKCANKTPQAPTDPVLIFFLIFCVCVCV